MLLKNVLQSTPSVCKRNGERNKAIQLDLIILKLPFLIYKI